MTPEKRCHPAELGQRQERTRQYIKPQNMFFQSLQSQGEKTPRPVRIIDTEGELDRPDTDIRILSDNDQALEIHDLMALPNSEEELPTEGKPRELVTFPSR